jgi:hypothetical protein
MGLNVGKPTVSPTTPSLMGLNVGKPTVSPTTPSLMGLKVGKPETVGFFKGGFIRELLVPLTISSLNY